LFSDSQIKLYEIFTSIWCHLQQLSVPVLTGMSITTHFYALNWSSTETATARVAVGTFVLREMGQ